MIKGIVIGAVEGLNEYLYLPLEWIAEGLEAVKGWFVTLKYFRVFPLLLKHGINPF